MQSTESKLMGFNPKEGANATMQSAGDENQRAGFLDPMDESLSNKYVTIEEALEAAADSSEDKPMEASDVATIEAAERQATGLLGPVRGGISSVAQATTNLNPRLPCQREPPWEMFYRAKVDVSGDKAVTWEDARAVKETEDKLSMGR